MRTRARVTLLCLGVAGCGSEEAITARSDRFDAGSPVPTATSTSPVPVPQPDGSTAPPDGGAKACFSACGGDPTGLWRLESTCFADLTGGCKSGVTAVQFDVTTTRGLYLFSGSNVSLQVADAINVALHYGAECAARTSAKTPSPATCAALDAALAATKSAPGVTLSDDFCNYSPSARACDCGYVTTTDVQAMDVPYTRSGSTLTYATHDFQDSLEYCVDGDTLTLRPTSAHDVGVDVASVLRKVTPACTAKAAYCDGDAVYQCDDFGTAGTLVQTCAASDFCAFGSCRSPVCTPSAPACDGSVSTTCDALGRGYSGARDDCGARGLACSPGAGCVATTSYDIGESMYCFASPSSIGEMAGNFYYATADALLVEMAPFLEVPTATFATFAVYESAAFAGPYTNVLRVKRSIAAGLGFHSSGPINVPIRAGHYYGVFDMPDGDARPCSFNPGNTFAGFGSVAGEWFHADPKTASGDTFSDVPMSGNVYRQRLTVAVPAKDAGSSTTPLLDSGVPDGGP